MHPVLFCVLLWETKFIVVNVYTKINTLFPTPHIRPPQIFPGSCGNTRFGSCPDAGVGVKTNDLTFEETDAAVPGLPSAVPGALPPATLFFAEGELGRPLGDKGRENS